MFSTLILVPLSVFLSAAISAPVSGGCAVRYVNRAITPQIRCPVIACAPVKEAEGHMKSRYAGSIFFLLLGAVAQCWIMGVLLLTRQAEILILAGIAASAFWAWTCWNYFLRKQRLGQVLTASCLFTTLLVLVLCLLDMLDATATLQRFF